MCHTSECVVSKIWMSYVCLWCRHRSKSIGMWIACDMNEDVVQLIDGHLASHVTTCRQRQESRGMRVNATCVTCMHHVWRASHVRCSTRDMHVIACHVTVTATRVTVTATHVTCLACDMHHIWGAQHVMHVIAAHMSVQATHVTIHATHVWHASHVRCITRDACDCNTCDCYCNTCGKTIARQDMNELCRTHKWVISHMWRVVSRTSMRHVTHLNGSGHAYKWVTSHMWISHVTHMNASCHTYG